MKKNILFSILIIMASIQASAVALAPDCFVEAREVRGLLVKMNKQVTSQDYYGIISPISKVQRDDKTTYLFVNVDPRQKQEWWYEVGFTDRCDLITVERVLITDAK